MRLFLTTLLVSTLAVSPLLSQASAIHPSRREHPSSSLIVSSRQHRVPRSILDLCINANVDLLVDASQLLGLVPILGSVDLGSKIQLCLCLKDLDIFLDTNVDIRALVGVLGKNTVSALITALVETSSDASQCSFPLHAHHTCNKHDPCHYECNPHYVHVGDTCVCAPPYISCNGVCDIFPKGCGSIVPHSFKAREGPITTITQAKATCKLHQTVCGIPGREDTFDFECIDIDTTDDSCGGCMAAHPFPKADPVPYVSGTDCTRIAKVKNSKCSGQRCIVSECKPGWVPNLTRDTCILDLRKREDSLITNVAANDISSDLVAKIGAIVRLVSGLECASSQIPASSSSSAPAISDLLNGVVDATSTLIASTTVSSLLINLDALLNVSSLLSSTLSSCDCGTDLEDALGNIVAALLNLKSWCAHNVPSGLNLSGLLSGLDLNKSTRAIVSSDLVDQIKSLIGLVVGLAGVRSSLPPPSFAPSNIPASPSGPSSINTNIIDSIINATVYIVNSSTVPSLVSGIGALVNVSSLASSLLDHCKCVGALGLGPLVADLAQITNAALRMQDWCDTHPIASIPQAPAVGSSSTGASTSTSNTDELSIDLGLSNLLSSLGSVESGPNGLLDGILPISTGDILPVSAVTLLSTTIGVLSPSTLPVAPSNQETSVVNDLSGLDLPLSAIVDGNALNSSIDEANDLGAGPADASASVTSDLLTRIGSLVDIVLSLVGVTLPAPGPSNIVDSSVIDNVLQATKALLSVSSVGAIETQVNGLVAASLASVKTLDNCGCVDKGLAAIYNSLVQVTRASLDLQDWCNGHSMLVSPSLLSSTVNYDSQPSTTTSDIVNEPTVVDLTKLLNGFGLLVDGLNNNDAPLISPLLQSV